ncbi:MAG: flagellar basal body L-ring protein FlgH [Rhodopirellula sp. JB055]|uniref:flagellar basal body L-ring protein FlgH n=1 Tax=Rhodopirellula sp. JB055 TaxID=3342846 RepID=UPI00370B6E6E
MILAPRSFAAAAMSLMFACNFVSAQNSSLLHATPPWMPNAPTSQVGMVAPAGNLQTRAVPGVGPDAAVMPPEFLPPGMAERAPNDFPPRDAAPSTQPSNAGQASNRTPTPPAVGLAGVSWTYQPAPPMRAFRVQDIVTIRVDEIARMTAEGDTEKRRVSLFQATLADWIKLGSGGLIPDPQSEGDPTVDAQTTANSRAEASVESRESMSFNIAARIVDIRPNGNLVVEARKQYRVNDNLWETSLSGICRAQDIGPDNVVLSRDLIDLEINKQDQGQLRDGYRRGWFQRAFDRLKPF